MSILDDKTRGREAVMQAVGEAFDSGHFLIGVWKVEENGDVAFKRVTEGFNRGKFPTAISMLVEQAMIEAKIEGIESVKPKPEPLPVAPPYSMYPREQVLPPLTEEERTQLIDDIAETRKGPSVAEVNAEHEINPPIDEPQPTAEPEFDGEGNLIQ